MLLDETAATPLPSIPIIKNGLVLELYAVLKSYKLTWASFSNCVHKLYPGGTSADTWAVRTSIVALSTRYAYLKKTPKWKAEVDKLLNTPYILPTYQGSSHSTEVKPPVVPAASRFQTETTVLVNKSLAAELAEWKQKYENLLQVKQLEEKYKLHNVRRREKRKEKKICCQADKIDKLEKQLDC